MKLFFNVLKASGVLLLAMFMNACSTSDDTDPGGGNQDPVELSIADIVGRWGIQSTTENGGAAQARIPCKNTLEIESNGDFLIVDANEGTWLEGNATFNQADSVLTLTITGQTLTVKILSVSATAFELQSTDGSGATQTVSVSEMVKLESADCASFEREEILTKWSINEFTRSRYVDGQLDEENSIENIATNQFTIEFRSDGSALTFDYINEYDFSEGTFRMLDNHNLVVDFDQSDDDPGSLIHLDNVQWPYWIFESVEWDEESGSDNEAIVVTTFSLIENDEQVPTISEQGLLGKWSASSIAQRTFHNGQLVDESVNDRIPHNKMTVEFFEGDDLQFIDLVEDFGFSNGAYRLLDGSNLLMSIDESGEEEYDLFQVVAVNGDEIILRSFEVPEDHGGQGGGEANNGHENEYDVRHSEITLNKNTGDEPSITGDELLGNWEVTEVENLAAAVGDENSDGDGPQVGMVLNFASGGSGMVTVKGQEVARFDFELIDGSNLALIFEDDNSDQGGNANDNHEDDSRYTVFHVNARPAGALELILYEPSRSDDHDDDNSGGGAANDGHGEGNHDQDEGGATHRIVMEKQ